MLSRFLRARELGFSLDEIRELLRLVDERDQPCAEARAVAAAHLDDVRAKIADLKRNWAICLNHTPNNSLTLTPARANILSSSAPDLVSCLQS